MEHTISLPETEDTPKIVFDKENNVFEIIGRSMPENAPQFYDPLHNWLGSYANNPNPITEVHFKLDYFNSASSLQIKELISQLEKIPDADKKVKVVWFYTEFDEIMHEKGEDLRNIVRVPFELRVY
jgi:hypothetical protein